MLKTLVTSARRWERHVKASQTGGRYIPALTVGRMPPGKRKRGALTLTGTSDAIFWVAPFLGGKII